mgnify:CR=1 FL=1
MRSQMGRLAWVAAALVSVCGSAASAAQQGKIWDAVDRGDLARVRALSRSNPKILITPHGMWRETILGRAAWRGHAKIVRYCVRSARPTKTDLTLARGRAARGGHTTVCRLLLDSGALLNPRARCLDRMGNPPLGTAIEQGHTPVVTLFLSRGADPDACVIGPMTPLALAAQRANKDCVKLLLAKDADVNLEYKEGDTALYQAMAGVVVHRYDPRSSTRRASPREAATREEIALLLLKHDADPTPPGHMLAAARLGYKRLAKKFLEMDCDVNERSKWKLTPLHFAAACRDADMCKLLLDNAADVNALDHYRRTPLFSVLMGHSGPVTMDSVQEVYKLVKLLIDRGADVRRKSTDHKTPLSWARSTLVLRKDSGDRQKLVNKILALLGGK